MRPVRLSAFALAFALVASAGLISVGCGDASGRPAPWDPNQGYPSSGDKFPSSGGSYPGSMQDYPGIGGGGGSGTPLDPQEAIAKVCEKLAACGKIPAEYLESCKKQLKGLAEDLAKIPQAGVILQCILGLSCDAFDSEEAGEAAAKHCAKINGIDIDDKKKDPPKPKPDMFVPPAPRRDFGVVPNPDAS